MAFTQTPSTTSERGDRGRTSEAVGGRGPADRRAPVFLQCGRPVPGRDERHRRPRQAGPRALAQGAGGARRARTRRAPGRRPDRREPGGRHRLPPQRPDRGDVEPGARDADPRRPRVDPPPGTAGHRSARPAAVEGARAWLNEHRVRPIEVEAFLLNETARLRRDLRPHRRARRRGLAPRLEDLEVGRRRRRATCSADTRLQLAAYANAEFIARVRATPSRYPLPPITRYGIVHVTDGGTRLYPAEVTDARLDRVPGVPVLHSWRRGRRRERGP